MLKNYYDKVLGCWFGKCLGGNLGQSYEGMKQRMDIEFTDEFAEKAIPNDDLDLQILWLDMLKEKGLDFNGEDLADAFARNCPYAPGEYAYFKKNYNKNIMPPLSGSFNNEFFNAGMGSPIRSEIWACVFFDNPDRAIEYAKLDSSLDHYENGDSYYGEVFLTALECLCFYGEEPFVLTAKALKYIPKDCEMYKTIVDVMNLCKKTDDMAYIQKSVLRRHGHSESCMAKQNIAFLIAAFLLFGRDFKKCVEEAVKCGFDADCTGATLGSILGIIFGGEKLKKLFNVEDMEYKLGVISPRTDFRISSLAKEVCVLGEKFYNEKPSRSKYSVIQTGNPCISFGEEKSITLKILPPDGVKTATLDIKIEAPATVLNDKVEMNFCKCYEATIIASLADVDFSGEGIKGEVFCSGERVGRFGLSVRRPWKVYGPYWKNEVVIPPLKNGDRYGKYVTGTTREERLDHMRVFHLTSIPDTDAITDIEQLKNEEFEIAESDTDIVKINESVGFYGNAVYFFETCFITDKKMTADLQVGRNVPFRAWLNGVPISEKDGNEHFYYEVRHKLALELNKGENRLVFMVVNNTDNGKFSYEFLTNSACSDHYMFKIKNIKKS